MTGEFVIQLPSISDSDPTSQISISLQPSTKYIALDSKLRQVKIRLDKVPKSDYKLNFFTLTLADQQGKQKQYGFPIMINVVQQIQSPKVTETLQIESQNALTAKIQEFNKNNQILIRFSTPLVPFNLTDLNSSSVDLHIEPFDNWADFDPNFNITKLNFTWAATAFDVDLLTIDIDFNDPIAISPKAKQDKLVWHYFENQTILVSKTHGEPLHRNSSVLKVQVPKMMLNNTLARFTIGLSETVDSTIKTFMLVSVIVNSFFPFLLEFLFDVIRSLQLVVHLPIFNVIVPGNVARIFSILIPICMYDLTSDLFHDQIRSWFAQPPQADFTATLSLDQMSDIGYDTYNPIINLGTLSFLLCVYLVKVGATFICLRPFRKAAPRIRLIYRQFVAQIFFG